MFVQLALSRLHIPFPSNAPTALLGAAAVPLLAGLLALAVSGRRWRAGTTVATWSALSALSTLALALPLLGTQFYLGGVSIDQEFRLQLISRMASSPAVADMTYSGLPSYYPTAWFWVGGRVADVFDIPAWKVYKPYAIITMAVAAALVFTVWSLVLRRRTAVLATLATAMVGLRFGSYEPYSWLLAALLPPVAVLVWHVLRCRLHRHGAMLVALGGYVGLCGAVYTLYLGFGLLVILVLGGLAVLCRMAPVRTVALRLVAIGAVGLAVMLPLWLPYLRVWLRSGRPAGAAPRFLPIESAVLPMPMLELSLSGAICLAGTVWLVVAARRSPLAQALGAVVVCGYVWYGLSTLALAVGQSLLALRIGPIIYAALAVAGVVGVVEGLQALRGRLSGAQWGPVVPVAIVLALVGAVALVQTLPYVVATDQAYTDYYPSGLTALGESRPLDDGAWNAQLDSTIAELSGKAPEQLVVLSTHSPLYALLPFHSFQELSPQYANPLADFDARRLAVESWARSTSTADLVHQLDTSPWRPPTVFVLRSGADGLHMTMSVDEFPRAVDLKRYEVVFPDGLFTGPGFVTRDVGPFLVAVRR